MAIPNFFTPVKSAYEKDCPTFTFRWLNDLDKTEKVKGKIINKDDCLIQFSEDIFSKKIKMSKELFFTDEMQRVYIVDTQTVCVKDVTIDMGKKNELHKVTEVKFIPKSLELAVPSEKNG